MIELGAHHKSPVKRLAMSRFFESFQADQCCLCGSPEGLSGEHKIKASALRAIFGNTPMVIGNSDGVSALRPAQGPKSKAFHFSARICSSCNGAHTQPPDREFDHFHKMVSELIFDEESPEKILDLPRYALGSEAYINVFRYFAKLLACHIAESSGPRALVICEFALGRDNFNPISLFIDRDPTYTAFHKDYGEHQYAAHGGLIVPTNPKSQTPTSFRSSLTLGLVRYQFWVTFNTHVADELKNRHPIFWRKCQEAYLTALESHIPKPDK